MVKKSTEGHEPLTSQSEQNLDTNPAIQGGLAQKAQQGAEARGHKEHRSEGSKVETEHHRSK